jgi:hypothetical protein
VSYLLLAPASAEVTTTPQSALQIGGGIGTALTMTGGGNAANVGGQRNDDGFSGPPDLIAEILIKTPLRRGFCLRAWRRFGSCQSVGCWRDDIGMRECLRKNVYDDIGM